MAIGINKAGEVSKLGKAGIRYAEWKTKHNVLAGIGKWAAMRVGLGLASLTSTMNLILSCSEPSDIGTPWVLHIITLGLIGLSASLFSLNRAGKNAADQIEANEKNGKEAQRTQAGETLIFPNEKTMVDPRSAGIINLGRANRLKEFFLTRFSTLAPALYDDFIGSDAYKQFIIETDLEILNEMINNISAQNDLKVTTTKMEDGSQVMEINDSDIVNETSTSQASQSGATPPPAATISESQNILGMEFADKQLSTVLVAISVQQIKGRISEFVEANDKEGLLGYLEAEIAGISEADDKLANQIVAILRQTNK
ncbi:MAG: hypothetical protein FD145_1305 [Candidatus Saganbacteria bacterium]|uniref:Uncharacterized protein n=1 Tax=Candidatus Saganbacteria bacterium TaxID=2575572 RepID=A0A833L038_UNCSA|nr:MAG: hypothetical protein FD145_1305 [Candidatus Saganbacteria bacterium]